MLARKEWNDFRLKDALCGSVARDVIIRPDDKRAMAVRAREAAALTNPDPAAHIAPQALTSSRLL